MAEAADMKVGIIPGTGRMGSLLAMHLAKAGLPVFLGSRSADKAIQSAVSLSRTLPPPLLHNVQGGSNAQAAAWANVIVWSPSGSLQDREALLRSLASHLENKVIIDITNIMYFFDESQWGQTSSVLLNQKALGVPARWTTAFKSTFWVTVIIMIMELVWFCLVFSTATVFNGLLHVISLMQLLPYGQLFRAEKKRLGDMSNIVLHVNSLQKLLEELPDPENPHHTFVAGDDEEAIRITIALVEAIPGFKAVRAGGLANSKMMELLGPRWLVEMDKLNAGGRFRSGWKYVCE